MAKKPETLTPAEEKLLRKPIARVELNVWEKSTSSIEVTIVDGRRLTDKQLIDVCIAALREHRKTI